MDTAVERHPLTTLMARHGWTASAYLQRVADRHRALGHGCMATRREKVSRWIAGTAQPSIEAQLAMAHLHDVHAEHVHRLGWPHWLLLALPDDQAALESPWTPTGTVQALDTLGGTVDRRGFLIASSATLLGTVAAWAAADPATATPPTSRRIDDRVPDLFEARLETLRHLDDQVGAARAHSAATAELRLITDVLRDASYTERTGRRLFACAAEASRISGWTAYDCGRTAVAEQHFAAALRAAALSGDTGSGAVVLAFWGNLRYTNGDPVGAQHLFDGALQQTSTMRAPRLRALLHARKARAYAVAGEPLRAYRAADAALGAYGRVGQQDPDAVYWVNEGEIHQFAASTALTLGDAGRALEHFALAYAADDPYDPYLEARGAAIYLARQAEAHLALGDVDAAAQHACRSVDLGGTDSARVRDLLMELDASLAPLTAAAAVDARDRIRHALSMAA